MKTVVIGNGGIINRMGGCMKVEVKERRDLVSKGEGCIKPLVKGSRGV
jgi:hypothetical protein